MSAVIDLDMERPEPPKKRGAPSWNVALLFPPQGEWTEAEFLALKTNQLVELSDGCLEVLPVPTPFHQFIAQFLFKLLEKYLQESGNDSYLFMAPLRVRLWPGKIREPDIVLISRERVPDVHKAPNGADLAVEIVSGCAEDRERDLVIKREEYARAGIAEYWIIEPDTQTVTILILDGTAYREHGVFRAGSKAPSVLLPGFEVDVAQVFAAGMGK